MALSTHLYLALRLKNEQLYFWDFTAGYGVNFTFHHIYRVSQEERTKLRESVPYVKLCRYNPKHLYPKLNGYEDNGQRKVWTSCISAYCTSTAVSH